MFNVARDIFWTHLGSIKLLNAFHIVLVIDIIYQMNGYQLPLLEIVVITLIFEEVNNFTYTLQKFRKIILKNELMENIFSKFNNLLCEFHFAKNVRVKCIFASE
ncbi:hypothetical protein CR513_41139, partial [Mucuna pruriens]